MECGGSGCVCGPGGEERKDGIADNLGQRDIRVKDEEEGIHRADRLS